MGYLLLEGGAEFGGGMREPDRKAMELAGGSEAPIRILPTAAAADHNHQRAGNNGVRWFQSLGARDVRSLPLIDRVSANDHEIVAALRQAKLIYMLGGFPGYLAETLKESAAWEAVLQAYDQGAVVAGSSAGAMVMCARYYDPGPGRVANGLGLVRDSLVMPHYNTFGKSWAARLLELSGTTLIGIDEQTGMLAGQDETWTVYGAGNVTLYRQGQIETHSSGKSFSV